MATTDMIPSALTLTKSHRDDQTLQQYTYDPGVIDKAVMLGDMKQMDAQTRLAFYRAVCLSVGLNPLTQPFTPLERQDKTVWLYANSSCTQQLAALHKVSYRDIRRTQTVILGEPFYCVEVTAVLPDGRTVPSQSVVALTKKKKTQRGTWPNGDPKWVDALDEDGEPIMVPLRGESLANAIMKSDTKALRRATLALIGLGWMQVDFEGRAVTMDLQTGELQRDAREIPAVPLLAHPTEQAKTLTDHISDLYGDSTRADSPRVAEEASATEELGLRHEVESLIAAQGGPVEANLARWYTWAERRFKTERAAFTEEHWQQLLRAVHEAERVRATQQAALVPEASPTAEERGDTEEEGTAEDPAGTA